MRHFTCFHGEFRCYQSALGRVCDCDAVMRMFDDRDLRPQEEDHSQSSLDKRLFDQCESKERGTLRGLGIESALIGPIKERSLALLDEPEVDKNYPERGRVVIGADGIDSEIEVFVKIYFTSNGIRYSRGKWKGRPLEIVALHVI